MELELVHRGGNKNETQLKQLPDIQICRNSQKNILHTPKMFSHKIGGIGWNFVNLTADSVTAVDWQTGRLKTGS